MINKVKIGEKLSKFIKTQRAEAGLTQQKLAERADLSYKQIQRLETPTRKEKEKGIDPQLTTLYKLSRALNVDIDLLIKKIVF